MTNPLLDLDVEPFVARPEIERRLLSELESGKLVFLVGPRGSGKTFILQRLLSLLERDRSAALIQIEPIAASPEILCNKFLDLAREVLPAVKDAPDSYDRLLSSLSAVGNNAVLLLDELTELRTLSYFRDVDKPLESFLEALTRPRAPKCLATSRFPALLAAHLEGLPKAAQSRVETIPLPPLSIEELSFAGHRDAEVLIAVTGGLPVHVAPLLQHIDRGESFHEALTEELQPGGRIETECRVTLSELLHRARGYGACKSVLSILADEENLNLTEIARRMNRTAGSTRDYLRWLEEVELIRVRDRRFSFVDPLLRVWLRIHGTGHFPSGSDIRNEIESYVGPAIGDAGQQREEPAPAESSTEAMIEID
jgi:predicted AAA+ superfamily ATPase